MQTIVGIKRRMCGDNANCVKDPIPSKYEASVADTLKPIKAVYLGEIWRIVVTL